MPYNPGNDDWVSITTEDDDDLFTPFPRLRVCSECGCGADDVELCEACQQLCGNTICIECCECCECSCGYHIPRAVTVSQMVNACRDLGLRTAFFTDRVLTASYGARCNGHTRYVDTYDCGEARLLACPGCIVNCGASLSGVEFPPEQYEEVPHDETVTKPGWIRRNGGHEMAWHRQHNVHFWRGDECQEMPAVFVGVEIECDRGGSEKLRNKVLEWKSSIVSDGSVSAGFEIATAPASGDKFVQLIHELTDEAKRAHGFITQRCGLHVHVDCRDLSDEQKLLLTGLWCLFEHHFIAMMPPSRRGENQSTSTYYCKPLSPRWRAMQAVVKGTETPEQMLGFLLNRRFATPDWHSGDRYKAWNLQAIGKYNTIECRLHSGTLQPEKIIPWAAILASLKLAVVNLGQERLVAHLSQPKPTRELLLELLWNDQARDYVISRQETFREHNQPDSLVALLNPISEYRDAMSRY